VSGRASASATTASATSPRTRASPTTTLELLPLVNSGTVAPLDHPRLIAQLTSLERRTSCVGRDTVDHPPGGRDVVVNAASGALVVSAQPGRGWIALDLNPIAAVLPKLNPYQQQIAEAFPYVYESHDDDLTCGQCVHRDMKKRGLEEQTFCGLRLFFIKDKDRACDVFELRYE